MTGKSIIREEKAKSLSCFAAALENLDVDERHLEAMHRAGTVRGSAGAGTPRDDDAFGWTAFNAAAFAALSEGLVAQGERIAALEGRLLAKDRG